MIGCNLYQLLIGIEKLRRNQVLILESNLFLFLDQFDNLYKIETIPGNYVQSQNL